MSETDTKLEAISLMRFLPAGAADIGDQVTRQDLRDAGVGSWSAPGDRRDDLRQAPAMATPLSSLDDYDEVLPMDPRDPDDEDTVIELRFTAS